MKLKQITLAVAATLAAGIAFADYTPAIGDTPQIDLELSGATAPDSFLQTIADGMFEPGYLYYTDDVQDTAGAYTATRFRAYFGKVKAGVAGTAAGKTTRLVKRSAGGSVWGVNPVARAQAVQTLGLTATDCTVGNGSLANPYRCKQKGTDPGLAGYPAGGERVPDFGVSDVAPFMFKGPLNVEFGQSQLSTTETANLAVKAGGGVVMGYSVTNAIPDTVAINKHAYGAMLNGLYRDWAQVDETLTTGNVVVCRRHPGSGTQTSYNWYFNNFPCAGSTLSGVDGASVVAPGTMNGSDDLVLTASRKLIDSNFDGKMDCQDADADGQCTFTDSDLDGKYDLGEPTGDRWGLDHASHRFLIDPTVGYTVVENSGSGDVRNCLKGANAHTDYNLKGEDGKFYTVEFSKSATAMGAIGVLSLDSLFKESGWSFRNVDGTGKQTVVTAATGSCKVQSTPSVLHAIDVTYTGNGMPIAGDNVGDGADHGKGNVKAGKYDFVAELTYQYRNATVDGVPKLGSNPANGDAAAAKAFADEFITRAGNPSFNACPWVAALPVDYDATVGVDTAKATRAGNMCAPVQMYY